MGLLERGRTVAAALELALSDARYAALAVVSAPIVFGAYAFATSIPGQGVESWLFSVGPAGTALYAVLAALIAVTLALQAFAFAHRVRATGRKGLVGGAFAALFVSGCCTSLFAPVLALGGGAAVGAVAKYGAELTLASALLIGYALAETSRDVACALPKRSA